MWLAREVQCFHEFEPMDRPPVHELSAVNGHSLRFKCRATPGAPSRDVDVLVPGYDVEGKLWTIQYIKEL